MRMWRSGVLLVVALLAGCGRNEPVGAPAPDLHAPVTAVEWALPTLRPGTHSPGLTATHDGRLLLSWVNSQRGRRHVVQFSAYDTAQQRWRGAPVTVVIGNSLHLDWRNVPQMAVSRDGALWAQWLQSGGGHSEPYVMVSHSRDGGANWSEPQTPGQAGASQAFVSLWAEPDHGVGLAWREIGVLHDDASLSQRATRMQPGGPHGPDTAVDGTASDCAQSSAAMTTHGPLLAWRRRGTEGGRDIWTARRDGGEWSAPVRVHADGGTFAECLISGPLLAAHAETAAVAWMSADVMPGAALKLALSPDGGDSFLAPIEVIRGNIVPFALALDAQQAWLLWTQYEHNAQSLWLSRRSVDLQKEYERREIARAPFAITKAADFLEYPADIPFDMGIPRFALHQGAGYVVWTLPKGENTSLRGLKLLPPVPSPQ